MFNSKDYTVSKHSPLSGIFVDNCIFRSLSLCVLHWFDVLKHPGGLVFTHGSYRPSKWQKFVGKFVKGRKEVRKLKCCVSEGPSPQQVFFLWVNWNAASLHITCPIINVTRFLSANAQREEIVWLQKIIEVRLKVCFSASVNLTPSAVSLPLPLSLSDRCQLTKRCVIFAAELNSGAFREFWTIFLKLAFPK